MIDHVPADANADLVAAVNLAAPMAGAERVEMVGMLVFEKCLGFPIAALLSQIGLDGIAAVMPDLRRGENPME